MKKYIIIAGYVFLFFFIIFGSALFLVQNFSYKNYINHSFQIATNMAVQRSTQYYQLTQAISIQINANLLSKYLW